LKVNETSLLRDALKQHSVEGGEKLLKKAEKELTE
jgi:hypothetical protein